MARLAVRVTSDKSTREKITAANEDIYIDILIGNKTVRHLRINEIGDVLQRSIEDGIVYWVTYTRNGNIKS